MLSPDEIRSVLLQPLDAIERGSPDANQGIAHRLRSFSRSPAECLHKGVGLHAVKCVGDGIGLKVYNQALLLVSLDSGGTRTVKSSRKILPGLFETLFGGGGIDNGP